MHPVHSTSWVSKSGSVRTQPCPFFHVLSPCAVALQEQSSVVVTELMWSAKLKIFILWSFKTFANLCLRARWDLIQVRGLVTAKEWWWWFFRRLDILCKHLLQKVSLPGEEALCSASETPNNLEDQDSVLSKSGQELPVHGEEFFSQPVPSLSHKKTWRVCEFNYHCKFLAVSAPSEIHLGLSRKLSLQTMTHAESLKDLGLLFHSVNSAFSVIFCTVPSSWSSSLLSWWRAAASRTPQALSAVGTSVTHRAQLSLLLCQCTPWMACTPFPIGRDPALRWSPNAWLNQFRKSYL